MSEDGFIGKLDGHRGVTVSSKTECCQNLEQFAKKLEVSLKKWTNEKLRSVWFEVHLSQADWISVLAKNGFTVHHGKGDLVNLVKWLPKDEKNVIPPFAHNTVGAGAIVINDKDEILTVQEKYADYTHWKLPGGYVEPLEDIGDAAQREVLEETTIQTEFISVIAFRHSLQGNFGCSDIYFIVWLKPLTHEISKEESEVKDCKWMNVQEFINHPNVHENNRLFVRTFLNHQKSGLRMTRQRMFHPISKKPQRVYLLTKVEDS
ncbi:nudix hydrolase 8 isoform X2 [Cimex lectularius]|nr:nudix hydrolase 8 isoform X2 [Cimex lectularius]